MECPELPRNFISKIRCHVSNVEAVAVVETTAVAVVAATAGDATTAVVDTTVWVGAAVIISNL